MAFITVFIRNDPETGFTEVFVDGEKREDMITFELKVDQNGVMEWNGASFERVVALDQRVGSGAM